MSLSRIGIRRIGSISFKLLRDEESDKVLLAVDKHLANRTIRGPLFTEWEVRHFCAFIKEHYDRPDIDSPVLSKEPLRYDPSLARREIEQAIQQVCGETFDCGIRVLPSLPPHRNCESCWQDNRSPQSLFY